MINRPIPKEDKRTPDLKRSSNKQMKFLPIVFTSQIARNNIEQMNAKMADVRQQIALKQVTPTLPVVPSAGFKK